MLIFWLEIEAEAKAVVVSVTTLQAVVQDPAEAALTSKAIVVAASAGPPTDW